MDFFEILVRCETYLWNHLDDRLRAHDCVSLGTLAGMRIIARHADTCRVQEISTDLGITVGAASKLVDRLERASLAARSAHPADRRSHLITLTPAGRAAHDAGVALLDTELARLLDGETGVAEATATLARILGRLTTPSDLTATDKELA